MSTRTAVELPRAIQRFSSDSPIAGLPIVDADTVEQAQAAIDDPVGSKIIRLWRSATPRVGTALVLKERDADAWTGISYQGTRLPARTRYNPTDHVALQLPVIQSPTNGSAMTVSGRPQRYVLDGIGLKGNGSVTAGLLEFGFPARPTAEAQRFWINQCTIWQTNADNYRAGISNPPHGTEVSWNWIEGIKHSSFQDAQAMRLVQGSGSIWSHHNFYESVGEIIAFGGGDPATPNPLLGDVLFEFDHLYKRKSWNSASFNSKNGEEAKQVLRRHMRYCIVENLWQHLQAGQAFGLWSVNQDGARPDMLTADYTVERCWLKNVAQFMLLSNKYYATHSNTMRRLTFSHNVVTGLDAIVGAVTGARSRVIQLLDSYQGGARSLEDVTIDHNFAIGRAGFWMQTEPHSLRRIHVTRNIGGVRETDPQGRVFSNTAGNGQAGWDVVNQYGDCTWATNAMVGALSDGRVNPSLNTYVNSVAALGLVNGARAFDLNCTLAQLADLKPGPGSLAAGKGPDIDDIMAVMAAEGVETDPADLPQ